MPTSATLAINDRCNRLRREGREVFKLGLGQSPFPVPATVVRALRKHAHEKDYLEVQGLHALREAVSDYYRGDGLDFSARDVLVGPGSKELMFLLQLVYYGELVIPTPAWVSYAPQARIIGRRVKLLHTTSGNGWRLDAPALESLCKNDPSCPRIVILNYPSNPTGGTFTRQELEAIADVARRYRVVLLADEIYAEVHHHGQHVSISRFYPEGTIISSGLSKWCGAGGWRLGTFVFPGRMRWLLDAMAAAASETYTSTSSPIQYAAVTAFRRGPAVRRYLKDSRRVLCALGAWAQRRLVDAGVQCVKPVGGFYVFPDFTPMAPALAARGIRSSRELCERLLEDTGVAILPGSEFGRPAAELTARLAYVDFDGDTALEAAGACDGVLDEKFVLAYCPRVTAAVDRLVEWLRVSTVPAGSEPRRLASTRARLCTGF